MKEKIKAILDEDCYQWELKQLNKFRDCKFLRIARKVSSPEWGYDTKPNCPCCHRNDLLTDRLADIMEGK